MQEKRRSYRIPVELAASFKVFEEQSHISLGVVNEVSALGFSMTTREFISPNEELMITVRFPEGQRLALPVKAVWTRQESSVDIPQYFVGFKLLEPLTSDTSKYIRIYVRYFFSLYHKKTSETQETSG